MTADDQETWLTEDEAVTAEEQRRGRSLDARLAEETRRDERPDDAGVAELVDDGGPDTEPTLVSGLAAPSERGVAESDEDTAGFAPDTGWAPEIEEEPAAAEQLAVTVRDEAPGATFDETDGYGDDEEET